MTFSQVKSFATAHGVTYYKNWSHIWDHSSKAVKNNLAVSECAVERDSSMNNMDVTAYWELLTPLLIPVPEPVNADDSLRPPTERDAPITPKFRYGEQFQRKPFLGTT